MLRVPPIDTWPLAERHSKGPVGVEVGLRW